MIGENRKCKSRIFESFEKVVQFLNACVHFLRSLADAVGGVGQFFD
jgi:hypothetical protein